MLCAKRLSMVYLALGVLAGCATGTTTDDLGGGGGDGKPATPASATLPSSGAGTGSGETTLPHPPPSTPPVVDAGASQTADDAAASDAPSGDAGSTIVEVPIHLNDCTIATCPASAPFPVGCAVTMTGDNENGCVASTPASAIVYFKAGERCDNHTITGKLLCSAQQGPALSAGNCTMNKSKPHYVTDKDMCPR